MSHSADSSSLCPSMDPAKIDERLDMVWRVLGAWELCGSKADSVLATLGMLVAVNGSSIAKLDGLLDALSSRCSADMAAALHEICVELTETFRSLDRLQMLLPLDSRTNKLRLQGFGLIDLPEMPFVLAAVKRDAPFVLRSVKEPSIEQTRDDAAVVWRKCLSFVLQLVEFIEHQALIELKGQPAVPTRTTFSEAHSPSLLARAQTILDLAPAVVATAVLPLLASAFDTNKDLRAQAAIGPLPQKLLQMLKHNAQLSLLDDQRGQPLCQCIRYLGRDSDNKRFFASQGASKPLVVHLRSKIDDTAKHAAAALANVALGDIFNDIADANTVNSLIDVLALDRPIPVATEVVAALRNLVSEPLHSSSVLNDPRSIPLLIKYLKSHGGEVVTLSATTLSSLVKTPPGRSAILAANVLPILLELIPANDESSSEALAVVWNMSLEREGRDAIDSQGVIPVLVEVFRTGTVSMKVNASGAIACLCLDSRIRAKVSALGATQLLVGQLNAPEGEEKELLQSQTAWALWSMACEGPIDRDVMIRLGAVPLLCSILRSGSVSTKCRCAGVLVNLLLNDEGTKRVIIEEDIIGSLVEIIKGGRYDRAMILLVRQLLEHRKTRVSLARLARQDFWVRNLFQSAQDRSPRFNRGLRRS